MTPGEKCAFGVPPSPHMKLLALSALAKEAVTHQSQGGHSVLLSLLSRPLSGSKDDPVPREVGPGIQAPTPTHLCPARHSANHGSLKSLRSRLVCPRPTTKSFRTTNGLPGVRTAYKKRLKPAGRSSGWVLPSLTHSGVLMSASTSPVPQSPTVWGHPRLLVAGFGTVLLE